MRRIAFGLLWVVVALVPLERVIILEGFGTGTKLIGIPAFGAGLLAVIERKRFRIPPRSALLLGLFGALSMASTFWSSSPASSAKVALTYTQLLGLIWLLVEVPRDSRDVKRLVAAYALGCGVVAAQLFREFLYGQVYVLYYLIERYSAFGSDPNELAVTLSIGIAFGWIFVVESTSAFKRLAWHVMIALLVIAIIMTGSRGGFISCVISLSVIPLSLGELRWKHRAVLASVLSVGLYIGADLLLASEVWERLATIDDELFGGSVSNRVPVWQSGIASFLNNPVLGVGAGAYWTVTLDALGDGDVAHNSFLSVLVELGLVGLLLYVASLITVTKSLLQLESWTKIPLLVALVTWGVGSLALTLEHSKFTWVTIGLALAWAYHAKTAPSTEYRGTVRESRAPSTANR